jgi:hypothetical protein
MNENKTADNNEVDISLDQFKEICFRRLGTLYRTDNAAYHPEWKGKEPMVRFMESIDEFEREIDKIVREWAEPKDDNK